MNDTQSSRFDRTDSPDEPTFEGYVPATPTMMFESPRLKRTLEWIFRRRGGLQADRLRQE